MNFNRLAVTAVLALGLVVVAGCKGGAANLSTDEAKANYAMGLEMGQQAKQLDLKIDDSAILAGVKDGLEGKEPQVPRQEIMSAIMKLQEGALQKLKKKGDDFLAANKAKAGVQTTQTGLQYEVLTEGKGAQPVDGDEVTVHYTGTLIDGTKFDSSVDRKEPAKFNVNQVIPGWTEAMKLMKVGSKWKITIPSELGYGPRGARPAIPPNAVLQFEVELLDVKKGEKPKEGKPKAEKAKAK